MKGADFDMSVRKITRYDQAFDLICVPYPTEKARSVISMLEREGHSEKSICFSVWKGQENLCKLRRDSRFWGAFINTVRKWSWPRDDPRWDNYWKRKREEERAQQEEERLRKIEMEKEARETAYRERYPGFVYFIRGESGGPIKIGYTTDITKRLNTLQTGYPDTLKLLALVPGSTKDELILHEEFTEYRMRGEWFKPVEPLLEKIKNKAL
jgi:hypothetical protein